MVERDEARLAGVALAWTVQRWAAAGGVGGSNGASSRPGDGKARAAGCLARRRAVAERLRQPRRAALALRRLLLDRTVRHLAQVAHAAGRPAAAAVAAVAAVAVALVAAVAVHRDCPVAAAASPLLTQVPQPTDAAAAQLRRVQMPSVKLDLLRLPRLHHTHTAHHTAHCTAYCTAHCTQ